MSDSEDEGNKYFLFYDNKKITTLESIQKTKQMILDLMERSDSVTLDKFTLYKKIPISLELSFEDK